MFGMVKHVDRIRSEVSNYLTPKNPQAQLPRREEMRRTAEPARTPEKLEPLGLQPSSSVISSSTKQPKPAPKITAFNVEVFELNSRPVTSYTRMKVTVKNKRVSLEIGKGPDMEFKIDARVEDSIIESHNDNSFTVSSKKMEEFNNRAQKKSPPQWFMQITITNPNRENTMKLTLAADGTMKSQALKTEFLERCRQEGFSITKSEGPIEQKPEKEPIKEDNNELQKIRKSVAMMREEDKLMVLTDLFKIKKQFDYPGTNPLDKLRCPINTCQKTFQAAGQLRAHMKKQHPELSKADIELTEEGSFRFGQKAIDFALIMGKHNPAQVKGIIKSMKQKNIYEV